MNLEKHKFFKGDSYQFTVTAPYPDLTDYDVKCYLSTQIRTLTSDPAKILVEGDGLEVTNNDNGAVITVTISPTVSADLEEKTHYFSVKLQSTDVLKTIANGIIEFESFKNDYYTQRFRRFMKDLETKNKGEFLNKLENENEDLEIYLSQAVNDFNNSFFTTSFTLDDFPSDTLLFIGAALQLFISNGALSARCALTYQDAGGIIVSDMDRWGRYMQLFNQLFNYWKNGTLELKRSWNIELGFGEVPSDFLWGGFDNINILDDALF